MAGRQWVNRACGLFLIGMTAPASCSAQGLPPTITSVVNDASFGTGPISPGSWVAIFGTNLAPAGDSRLWNASTEILNGKLPTSLDGTSVTVNGKAAAVEFISPLQVNIQPPDDSAAGPVQVVVTTAAGASNSFTASYARFVPRLFRATSPYLAAQHADNSYVTPAAPVRPGEVIILWGTGFGPANPVVPAGQVFSGANPLANAVTATIGGQPAAVDFAGVVGAGLVQVNVHVPSSINDGDAGVIVTVAGIGTQTIANSIPIQNAAPQVRSVALSPASVAGGGTVQATVSLTAPAPTGGAIVMLSSSSSAASVPASVTVGARASSATFTVSTGTVSSDQTVTIKATYGEASAQAMLTVTPPPAIPPHTTLTSTLTFQPSGHSSGPLDLSAEADSPDYATYSAGVDGGVDLINGTASNQGQTFTFNTISPGGNSFFFGTTAEVVAGTAIWLDPVSSVTLSFTLKPSGLFAGSLSGTLSVTGTPHGGGAAVTLSGAISGNYSIVCEAVCGHAVAHPLL